MTNVRIDNANITVWRMINRTPDNRVAYGYAISMPGKNHKARDLASGVVGSPTEDEMLRTLCSFLAAAGEAYENPGSDNRGMFPEWVEEWASNHSDELADASEEKDTDNG